MPSFLITAGSSLLTLLLLKRYVYSLSNPAIASIIVFVLLLRTSYYSFIRPRYFSKLSHFPLPTKDVHWFWGISTNIQERPDMLFVDWIEQWKDSDIIRLRGMMGSESIVPVSVQAVTEVLSSQSYTFIKPPFIARSLNGVLGNGILFAEGDVHKQQRKLLMPAFSFGHVKSLVPIFLEESSRLISVINTHIDVPSEEGAEAPQVDVSKILSLLTLDIIYRAGLGVQFNALDNPDNELSQAYQKVFNPAGNTSRIFFLFQSIIPGFRFLPFTRNRSLWQARQTINRFANNAIDEKMEKYSKNEKMDKKDVDILSCMILEGDGQWTKQGIADQLMTFLVAGHETTASATAVALYLLSKNPEVQDRLRDEIRTQYPGGYSTIQTYEDIESLKYLNNVIREVLRHTAPVIATIRMAKEDTTVCGKFVPKGTNAHVPIVGLNRSIDAWGDDAMEFNPDRWNDRQAPNAVSFLTFLHGPRSCIGRRFAELEFKTIMLTLVGHFKFSLKEGQEVLFRSSITYRPKGGLPLTITAVEGW
ncbi:cytochrome P450 [Lipomyces arxii]|uniref:cytochrome P450 n=1 Tax=Lipomyces arxii TaxID=56418 RepID=UPI0034CE6193